MFSLKNDTKITQVIPATAAGTDDVEGTGVDMAGYGSVAFLVSFGAITTGGVTSIKAQASSDNGSADGWSDLEGTSITVGDTGDDTTFLLEVIEPRKRYIRVLVDRATQNAVVNVGLAVQMNPKFSPTTHAASITDAEIHASPAEGTA